MNDLDSVLADGAQLISLLTKSGADFGRLSLSGRADQAEKSAKRLSEYWQNIQEIKSKYPESNFIREELEKFLSRAKKFLPTKFYSQIYR